MVVRRLGRILDAAFVVLLSAIPVSALGFYVYRPTIKSNPQSIQVLPRAELVQTPQRPLDWYAPLWSRDLQQSPVDKSSNDVVVAKKPDTPVPQLMATLVDGGKALAHLRNQDGSVSLAAVGDQVMGFSVAAIEQGRVKLSGPRGVSWIELPNRE